MRTVKLFALKWLINEIFQNFLDFANSCEFMTLSCTKAFSRKRSTNAKLKEKDELLPFVITDDSVFSLYTVRLCIYHNGIERVDSDPA